MSEMLSKEDMQRLWTLVEYVRGAVDNDMEARYVVRELAFTLCDDNLALLLEELDQYEGTAG